jgi:predicted transcriptional regulator
MRDDDKNFNPDPNGDLGDAEKEFIESLRKKLEIIQDKLAGKNPENISLEDLAQYIRVVNYNFVVLTNLIQKMLTGQVELELNQLIFLEKLEEINKQLKEFFETNSFLGDTFKDESNNKED